jgi:[acyl-carrier-protein] S-malonyltransferase
VSTAAAQAPTAAVRGAGVAFVFPGQGSQYPGMGRDLAWCAPEAARVIGAAEEISGLPVHELLTRADAATIADPAIAQLLVHVHSVALLQRLRADGASCAVAAGHSLGEYSAMVAAGMLDWVDGLRLVTARGTAMAAAARAAPGSMAASVGPAPEVVDAFCGAARRQPVVVANVNSPRQTVVSGTADGVAEVLAAATAAGALRAKRLPVGGAYHSPLIAPAQDQLAPLLRAAVLTEPTCAFVSSITAEPVVDPERHRAALLGQITAPVRWRDTVSHLAGAGVVRYVEVGPGRVLCGLGREMHRDAGHEAVRPPARPPARPDGALEVAR